MMETIDPWAVLEEPATRTPRSLETREKSSRLNEWKEPTLLPEPTPRDGYRFKWVRSMSRGTDDKLNVDKRYREGWEPVRAEEHPEILAEWRMPANTTGLIEHGGLILCKMPEEMVQQRNSTYLRRSIAELNSAEEHYMRDNDEIVKKFADKKARTVFKDARSR